MMKQFKLTILLAVLLCMFGTKTYATIEIENADGVNICYKFINDEKELEVTHYSYKGNVVIPEEVTYRNKTLKVTSIGDEAFTQCTDLTSITIPNSVTSIGKEVFYGCI